MSDMPEFAHLDQAYRRYAALPDQERIAWIKADRWIGFDQAGAALTRLSALLDYPPRDRMPCLLIFGDTGMGKTKLSANLNAPIQQRSVRRPVLRIVRCCLHRYRLSRLSVIFIVNCSPVWTPRPSRAGHWPVRKTFADPYCVQLARA